MIVNVGDDVVVVILIVKRNFLSADQMLLDDDEKGHFFRGGPYSKKNKLSFPARLADRPLDVFQMILIN